MNFFALKQRKLYYSESKIPLKMSAQVNLFFIALILYKGGKLYFSFNVRLSMYICASVIDLKVVILKLSCFTIEELNTSQIAPYISPEKW